MNRRLKSEMSFEVSTTFSFDTELSADSVEWCPLDGFTDLLVVGTYQVDKSEEDQFSGRQRRGRIYLQQFLKDSESLQVIQVLETAAVLDLKWSPDFHHHNGSEVGVLASADANGDVVIYVITKDDETCELKQVSKFSLDDRLALSLDWNLDNKVQIAVSDSKGELTFLSLTPELSLEAVNSWKGHDFEAWIAAFDVWSPGLRVFSGGDDCKLKCFDADSGPRCAFVMKEHTMGVTSILSDVRNEFRLYSGSYDEKLHFWDTRSTRQPINTLDMGGGVWRIRQLRKKNGSRSENLLAVAAMHNGFHVVDADKCDVVASYTEEHKSLAYGVDFKYDAEECPKSVSDHLMIASCSFYDHTLKLWKLCVS